VIRAGLIAAVLALWSGAGNAGCLQDAAPCAIDSGTYHIERPAGIDPQIRLPAVMFLHGWGASGQATMSNRGMVDILLARGYAVIAPDGRLRDTGQGRTWDFHPARATTALRDEASFVAAVADDAAARHGIDRDLVILGGFSIGGSTASYIACKTPDAFAAFAPVAGSFWNPLPTRCAGPVRLLHVHGWTDTTVPLEGRRLSSGITQGDVFASMAVWRQTNGCTQPRPDGFDRTPDFQVRRWTSCAPGSALGFALHTGAHGIPKGWATLMLDWFAQLQP